MIAKNFCHAPTAISRLALFAFCLWTLTASAAVAQTFPARVVRVVDGDTVDILSADKNRYRVRLGEIDAPERDQPFGKEAQALLQRLALRQPVTVRMTGIGKFSRITARLSISGGASGVGRKDAVDLSVAMG